MENGESRMPAVYKFSDHHASLSVLGMLGFANAPLKVSIGPYLLFGAISLVLRARNMALTVVRGSG